MEDQAFFAIYGQNGILYLTDPNQFGGEVRFLPKSRDLRNPETARVLENHFDYSKNSRGLGPSLMADAIVEGKTSQVDKKMAGHVLAVLNAMLESGKSGSFIEISETCSRPEPMKKRTDNQ